MYITRLALDHFRSWDHCVLDIEPGITVLLGANGLGKTNLVESIEVIATGASHRTSSLSPVIQYGMSSATIRANTVNDDDTTTTYEVTINARGANRGRINGGNSQYMRQVVGAIPCVAFSPDDQRLVNGDPASRRVYINQAGVLLEPHYSDLLQRCTQIAKQRAALLKQLSKQSNHGDNGGFQTDAALQGLEIWTGQFIEAGIALTRCRAALVAMLKEPFAKIYGQLAGQHQHAELSYVPSFDEVALYDDPQIELSRHFQRLYSGEVARGQNLIGPQRDDLMIMLNGMPARDYASNGEMWTLALSLKMALYDVVREHRGQSPIVVLDDVFAQLDDFRRSRIMAFARQQQQVLITTASVSDLPDMDQTSATGIHIIDIKRMMEEQQQASDPSAMAQRFLETLDTGTVEK